MNMNSKTTGMPFDHHQPVFDSIPSPTRETDGDLIIPAQDITT